MKIRKICNICDKGYLEFSKRLDKDVCLYNHCKTNAGEKRYKRYAKRCGHIKFNNKNWLKIMIERIYFINKKHYSN